MRSPRRERHSFSFFFFAEKFLQLTEVWKEASGVWGWGCQAIPRFKNKEDFVLAGGTKGRWQRVQGLLCVENEGRRDRHPMAWTRRSDSGIKPVWWGLFQGNHSLVLLVLWALLLTNLYYNYQSYFPEKGLLAFKVDFELTHWGFADKLEKGQ